MDRSKITKGMEVRDSAGRHFGTVDDIEADGIKLTRNDSPDGRHHHVLFSAIDRVDDQVHLKPVTGEEPVVAPPVTGETVRTVEVAPARRRGCLGRVLGWLFLALGIVVLAMWMTGSFDRIDDGARGIFDSGLFSSVHGR